MFGMSTQDREREEAIRADKEDLFRRSLERLGIESHQVWCLAGGNAAMIIAEDDFAKLLDCALETVQQ